MSLEHLRNVMTGEIRPVETNSNEYVDLINEVYDHQGSARPKWEVTGRHHTSRLDADEVGEPDHGYAFKPIPGSTATLEDLRPEPHPERALTEAEVESGIESWEQKIEDLGFAQDRTDPGTEAEKLEAVDPAERLEKGQELAGSEGGSKRQSRGSSKSSEKSNGGSTGSGATGSGGTSGGGKTTGSTSSGSGSGSSGGSSS